MCGICPMFNTTLYIPLVGEHLVPADTNTRVSGAHDIRNVLNVEHCLRVNQDPAIKSMGTWSARLAFDSQRCVGSSGSRRSLRKVEAASRSPLMATKRRA